MDQPSDTPSAQATILRITGQILPARCIGIVAELGVADHLAREPMKTEALAQSCHVHGPSLYRIMRFLASIGIFEQQDDGTFKNTASSDVLREGVTGSVRPMVRTAWQDVVWDTYKALPQALQNGDTAFEIAHERPLFEHLAVEQHLGALFDASMALMSGPENNVIAKSYPFGDATNVMDIGGGRGGLLAAVLNEHENLAGTLFDQEQVVAEPTYLAEENLLGRCTLLAGDFFESIPAGSDIYMLKRILHDWSDTDAIRILHSIKCAMTPDSRIAVIDAVIKPGNDADPNKYLDVGIMTLLEGRERTAEEFETLFTEAGLQLLRIVSTPAPSTMSIIEGALA